MENSKTERPYLMDVDRMVEKPDPESAREELAVDGECFCNLWTICVDR